MVNRNPELLIALSARIRHLLFVVPAGINELAYWSLGFSRMFVAALLCFAFGYWYGERGMTWLERQLEGQEPATFRWIRRGVDRAGWALLLAFPGSNIVCALVGLRRMPPRRFAALLTLAVAIRLVWVRIAAEVFDDQLQTILRWIDRYQWYLVGAFLVLTIVQSSIKTARAERAKRQQ
jgi:membrane protein DedA with SNARE-associated domain